MTDRLTMDALFLAKVEATSQVDASPTAALNAIRVYDVFDPKGDFKYKTARDHVLRGTNRSALAPLTPSGRMGTWTVKVYGRGSQTTTAFSASNLPEADALLQACGLSQTVVTTVGAETVTYGLLSTGLKTVSAYSYVGGRLRKLLGAVSQCTLTWKAGGPIDYSFGVNGIYQAPSDVSTPASPVFGTSVGPIADGATVSFAGLSTLIVREFEMTIGNTVVERAQANIAGGMAYPRLTYAKPTFKLVVEDPLGATLDLENLQKTVATNALSWTIGSVQYNTCHFTAPAAIIETYDAANDNGIPVATVSGLLAPSTDTATDNFSLVWQ